MKQITIFLKGEGPTLNEALPCYIILNILLNLRKIIVQNKKNNNKQKKVIPKKAKSEGSIITN